MRFAATEDGFGEYIARYCDEVGSQDEYMDRVQNEEWQR